MKGAGREGLVTAVTGSLVRVRWLSGDETMVAPAPGTLSVLAAGRAAPQKGPKKSAARNTAGVTKKNIASKSAPPKESAAKKTAGATMKNIASKSSSAKKSGARKTKGS